MAQNNPFGAFWKAIRRRIPPWLRLSIAVALALMLIIFLFVLLRPGYDPLSEASMQPILNREILRVGVRTDIERFSYEEETGVYNGLEDDIARSLAKKIFGDDYLLQFEPVNPATRHIKLKDKQVDCVIAISPQNFRAEYIYSVPYYTDAVAVVVHSKSKFQSFDQFEGMWIGALTYPPANSSMYHSASSQTLIHEGAATVLQQFIASYGYQIGIRRYSSLPDMIEALENNEISAIAIENALLREYYSRTNMRVMPAAIGTVPYSIAIPADNPALVEIANRMITEMRESGELNALLDKWNLLDYREKSE